MKVARGSASLLRRLALWASLLAAPLARAADPGPGAAAPMPPSGAAAAPGDRPDRAAWAAYPVRVEDELRRDILPFWLAHARDRANGGFYGAIDNDLQVDNAAPRSAILTARILWAYSAAFRRYRDPAFLEMIRWAHHDLVSRFWDKEDGGLFWAADAAGRAIDPRKILYAQAFGIYALSEQFRATGDKAALDGAIDLYRLVESRARDRVHDGYYEEFGRDWTLSRDRGPRASPMGSSGQKSQNAQLHLLEAYTNLFRAWRDPGLKGELHELVEVVLDRVLDPRSLHLRLAMDEDWTPRSEAFSPGHDIEFSWLLTEAAEVLGDPRLLARSRKLAVGIAEATLEEGLDAQGGVVSEEGPDGPTNPVREWWAQGEAAVGFLNAYQISGDPRFAAASLRSWNFIENILVDRKNGEWFALVAPDGTRYGVKAGFWKCPYHDSRACMELLDRLRPMPAN